VGLVPVRRDGDRLAFAAPPLIRSGPVDDETLARALGVLGVGPDDVVDAAWADNGPGWVAVLLADAAAVLALEPDLASIPAVDVGVAGPHPAGSECAWEVRAFFTAGGRGAEDPVTGSLNASLAAWLLETGRATVPYVASQGTAIGRRGRVHIDRDGDGTIWVGGATTTRVAGTVEL
jgi:PhzF family phenazine biosynthesis protein